MKIKRIGFLATLVFTTMMINAQQFVGDWKGAISVQGVELELVFHITEEVALTLPRWMFPCKAQREFRSKKLKLTAIH